MAPAAASGSIVLAVQLKQLLFAALSDGPTYSALVPWVLDSDHKAPTLSEYAQDRQCLQRVQLQAGHARPQDMQQCVLQVVAEACQHGAGLAQDTCTCAAQTQQPATGSAGTEQRNSSGQPQQHAGKVHAGSSSTARCCSLSQPASRLAKLHGHLVSHLAAPDLAEQLHQLVLLLTAGPLTCSSSSSSSSNPSAAASKTSGRQGAGRQAANRSSPHSSMAAAAATGRQQPAQQQPASHLHAASQVVSGPKQLLPCRACAAEYAGKALQCCNKLLACMAVELQQALVCSPHLQQYSPVLANMLAKALATGSASSAGGPASAAAGTPAATPWPQQQAQPVGPSDCTPAVGGAGSASRPGVLGWAAAATPGSGGSAGAGTAWLTDTHGSMPPGSSSSKAGGRGPSRTPASARLSGLGLLMPTAPGTGLPGRPASAGQLQSGGKAAKTAAVCNREKSRDAFFTILRRASSRLDTLRQAQELAAAAAAAGDPQQQVAAAEAAVVADMAELLAEVSVAAKQLLLQLAPSNLGYLAELFMACVLQAASTGEPLLEPALVMMAEKDPGRFQKLQQRLADRAGGAGAAAQGAAGGTPGSGSKQAARAGGGGPAKQQQQQQHSQSAKQSSQQQAWPQPRAAGDRQDSSIAEADGSAHITHVRPRSRSAKQQQQQQQPHILATAGGAQPTDAAASGPSSGSSMAHKRLIPQRRIMPQANTTASDGQQQQRSAGQPAVKPAVCNGHVPAASPAPMAAVGAADSPLPAHCLSPLFAAASESPLMAAGVPPKAALSSAKAAAGSPLIKCSSPQQGAPLGAAAGAQEQQHSAQAHTAVLLASPCNSNTTTPAVRPPAGTAAAASLQKPGAPATATGKLGRPGTAATAAAAAAGPHSAPPKLQAVPLSNGPAAPGAAAASAALAQHGSGPALVMLQLMQLMPAGQHVLVLLLHAADSSSFNRALLGVMCSRVEKLLSSSPGSFTAASGLGQQAAAIAALGCYCSYLAFAAGAAEREAAESGTAAGSAGGSQATDKALLQQQPLLDIATMLTRLLAGAVPAAVSTPDLQQAATHSNSSSSSELDTAWRLALAVPFAVSCLRLAGLNAAAGASLSAHAAVAVLQTLRRLPALSPTSAGFGALPVCIGCCIQTCPAEQTHGATAAATDAAAATAAARAAGASSSRQLEGSQVTAEELSRVMASGSCLVDSSYWTICCGTGLQQVVTVLTAAGVAAGETGREAPVTLANGTLPLQQPPKDRTPARTGMRSTPAGLDTSGTAQQAGGGTAAAEGPSGAANAAGQTPSDAAGGQHSSTRSSPAGPAGPARHTTPLLLAPRGPPEVPKPPAVMLEALAAVSNPVRQQLQQAFIAQYSTDDNPVKMRDVLTVINGILFANSLSKALSQGLPGVLQKHLDLLQQAVQRQLAPGAQAAGGAGSTSPLQGQDLARAVHALYTQQLGAALPEALEAGMQAAADHACQAAAAACGALLPADVPPAAASTAAALVTASCKASCAQRLLQEVPVLVQSTLADATDDLVRLVNRQWAVHSRMTAAAAGATAAGPGAVPRTDSSSSMQGAVMRTDSSSSMNPGSGCSAEGKQPTRLQPVKLAAAAPSPACTAAAAEEPAASASLEACQQSPQAAGKAAVQTGSAGCSSSSAAGLESVQGPAALSTTAPHSRTTPPRPSGPVADGEVAADADSLGLAGAAGVAQPGDGVSGPSAEPAAAAVCAAAAGAGAVAGDPSVAPADPAAMVAAYMAVACEHVPLDWQSPQYDVCVSAVTAAAVAAAQQLVGGITAGRFGMHDVEQQLLHGLHQAQAAGQTASADAGRCCAAGMASALQQDQKQVPHHQHHVLLLLAGAVMHALLCSASMRAAVWDGRAAVVPQGLQKGTDGAAALPHLVQLPAVLMKAARGDVPVWLLRQLRLWMQAATLGCS